MPAPSPARGSAPTAPRCSRLTRMVSASSTILCDLRPLMSAIKPTPQESFSCAGSNRPKAVDASTMSTASFIPLAFLAAFFTLPKRPPVFRTVTQLAPAQDCAVLRHGRALQSRRQPLCRMSSATCRPMAACSLPPLAAVRRALVPAADLFAQLPPKGRRLALCGQQLGQQCCPKQKMANSRLKYKRTDACAEPEA